jgi:hypothetical protein
MRGRLLVIVALAMAPSACTTSIRSASSEAARSATPEVVNTGIGKLEDPEVADRLARALASPGVQAAMRELSSGLAEGALEGLSRDSMEQRVEVLANRITRAVVEEILFDPQVDYVRRSTDVQLDEETSGRNRAKLQALASALTESVVATAAREIPASVTTSMREELRNELGPTMREVMEQDVAPALAAALRTHEMRSALDETAHDLAVQAVLGSREGLAELQRQRGGFTDILVFFARHLWLLVPLGAPLLLVIPIIILWRELAAARRFRREVEEREARAVQRWRLRPARPGHAFR